MNGRRWHVYCRVVDNYGDAGVAWRLARQLARRGYAVEPIHSNRSQSQRERALGNLRRGRLQILRAAELRRPQDPAHRRWRGAGLLGDLLAGETPEAALKLGWAHGALLTTFPGDTTMATVEQVRAFAKGGSARIQR